MWVNQTTLTQPKRRPTPWPWVGQCSSSRDGTPIRSSGANNTGIASTRSLLIRSLSAVPRAYHNVRNRSNFERTVSNCAGVDIQYPRCIANPTGFRGHVYDLALHLRRLTRVDIVQQESMTCTAFLSAAVPLLALPGLAMSDNICALTVGTM
jgi:hypothetical protein